MEQKPLFVKAFPYQQGTLSLPVTDLDAASAWYAKGFGISGMREST